MFKSFFWIPGTEGWQIINKERQRERERRKDRGNKVSRSEGRQENDIIFFFGRRSGFLNECWDENIHYCFTPNSQKTQRMCSCNMKWTPAVADWLCYCLQLLTAFPTRQFCRSTKLHVTCMDSLSQDPTSLCLWLQVWPYGLIVPMKYNNIGCVLPTMAPPLCYPPHHSNSMM